MSIRFAYHQEIDIKEWDNCIARSFNTSIYSYSWYLDLVCDKWNALIEDKYIAVMPLPAYRFFGQDVILPPPLAYELGIFSQIPINHLKTHEFISAIPTRFSFYSTVLNKYNPVETGIQACKTCLRIEIDLIEPYHKLYGNYSSGLRQQLHTAISKGYSFSSGLSPNDLIRFIQENRIRIPLIMRRKKFRLVKSMIAALIHFKTGELFGVYDNHNELVSVALFSWNGSQINLLFHLNAPGRDSTFGHALLIDKFVEKYAETYATLVIYKDPAIVFPVPYLDFGGEETFNCEIRRNKLPFPLNRLIYYSILTTFMGSSQIAKS